MIETVYQINKIDIRLLDKHSYTAVPRFHLSWTRRHNFHFRSQIPLEMEMQRLNSKANFRTQIILFTLTD